MCDRPISWYTVAIHDRKARHIAAMLANAWAIGKRAQLNRYPNVTVENGALVNVNAMAVDEMAQAQAVIRIAFDSGACTWHLTQFTPPQEAL